MDELPVYGKGKTGDKQVPRSLRQERKESESVFSVSEGEGAC